MKGEERLRSLIRETGDWTQEKENEVLEVFSFLRRSSTPLGPAPRYSYTKVYSVKQEQQWAPLMFLTPSLSGMPLKRPQLRSL